MGVPGQISLAVWASRSLALQSSARQTDDELWLLSDWHLLQPSGFSFHLWDTNKSFTSCSRSLFKPPLCKLQPESPWHHFLTTSMMQSDMCCSNRRVFPPLLRSFTSSWSPPRGRFFHIRVDASQLEWPVELFTPWWDLLLHHILPHDTCGSTEKGTHGCNLVTLLCNVPSYLLKTHFHIKHTRNCALVQLQFKLVKLVTN